MEIIKYQKKVCKCGHKLNLDSYVKNANPQIKIFRCDNPNCLKTYGLKDSDQRNKEKFSENQLLSISFQLEQIDSIKEKFYSRYGEDFDNKTIYDFLVDINCLSTEFNEEPINEINNIINDYNIVLRL